MMEGREVEEGEGGEAAGEKCVGERVGGAGRQYAHTRG